MNVRRVVTRRRILASLAAAAVATGALAWANGRRASQPSGSPESAPAWTETAGKSDLADGTVRPPRRDRPPVTLLLIDVQQAMSRPPSPVPDAAKVSAVIADVLSRARAAGVKVIHVRNNGPAGTPDEPGTPGWKLVNEPRRGESVMDRREPDAFVGTDLAKVLPPAGDVILVGVHSESAIQETALSALRLGHQVVLVNGGHATRDSGRVSAAAMSKQVEGALVTAGVALVDPADVTFG